MYIWVLTTGQQGMLHQALGLAESLNPDELKIKTVHIPWILSILPSKLYPFLSKFHHPKAWKAPWPDFCISCGRKSVLAALALKHLSKRGTYLVHIQDPHIHPEYFDIVVALQHDSIIGKRVIKTYGAIHPWTEQKIYKAQQDTQVPWTHLPKPYSVFLVGGNTNHMHLNKQSILKLNTIIQQVYDKVGGSILLSVSRRTPKKLIKYLKINSDIPAYFYLGDTPNPYLQMISQAQRVFITNDSISLISEVIATGNPIFLLSIHKGEKPRFKKFFQTMLNMNIIKIYEPNLSLDPWNYKKLYETPKVAKYVLKNCVITPDYDRYINPDL